MSTPSSGRADPNGIATDEEIASWYRDGEGPWIQGHGGHAQLSRAVNRIRADAVKIRIRRDGRSPVPLALTLLCGVIGQYFGGPVVGICGASVGYAVGILIW